MKSVAVKVEWVKYTSKALKIESVTHRWRAFTARRYASDV